MFVPPPTLLISDDDSAFRETLRSVFVPRGFTTLLANDGEEALRIVRQTPVHLLVTDMYMPRMTGLETIRQIRRARLLLPCILMSAGANDDLVAKARDVNAFSVLRKPIRFPEITGAVQEAMKVTYGWMGESTGS